MTNQEKTLNDWEAEYKNEEEYHKHVVEVFTGLVNDTPYLKQHRDYVEQYGCGLGERSFLWMWKLLVDKMPSDFKFLEIGVFKGQIVSLMSLLAVESNRFYPQITGVTMLSPFSGNLGKDVKFPDCDYLQEIKDLHSAMGLPFDENQIVKGDSTDPQVQAQAGSRGPFDIVYVDGCHEYDYVCKDLDVYGSMVKKGGYLVVDDSSNFLKMYWGAFPGIEDVSRAVRDKIENNPEWKQVFVVMHNRIFQKV
jgi:hypothetical protein